MYKIKTLKNKKKNKEVIPPKFKSKNDEFCWYRKQQMKEQLLNIKHVSIQYKDIKKMLFSNDKRLVNLYMRTDFNGVSDEDYISISRFKDGCDIIVSLIINSDWLINEEILKNMSEEEINIECLLTENKIHNLKKLYQTEEIENKIVLLEYKLNCIREYLDKNKTLTLR